MLKRLIYLTRLNIGLLVLASLAFLNRMDSGELGRDIRALDLIEKVVTGNSVPKMLESGRVYTEVRDWLRTQDSSAAKHNYEVRGEITELLKQGGMDDDNVVDVKGRDGSETTDHFRLIEILFDNQVNDSPLDTAARTVNETLAAFDELTQPRNLRVAVELHDHALEQLALNQREQSGAGDSGSASDAGYAGPDYMGAPQLVLESVALENDLVTLSFAEDFTNSNSQSVPLAFTDKLRVATVLLPGPSLYELANGHNPDVEALVGTPEQVGRLNTIYGDLKLKLAQSIVTEEFIRSYKSINVLGFSISTHRFPLAIMFLMLASTVGIAWTVEAARSKLQRVLTDGQDDDLVHSVLNVPVLRFGLWVIVPVFAIWVSLPLYPLPSLEQYLVVGGVVLIVLLAGFAVVRARAL